MDFYKIRSREIKGDPVSELYPDFTVGRSKDLMVRGHSFYAIWDEACGLWSTDEYDVQRLVDEELYKHAEDARLGYNIEYNVKYLSSSINNGWGRFKNYLSNLSDNHHELDSHLTFANTEVKKSDYVSRRLPYPLAAGDYSAWDELVGTLYSVEERAKIEWAIGAIVSGDSKHIQKFVVLYGPAGTGKSTILNIVQGLFDGYTTSFEAKALGSNSNAFATEVFKNNPLVAIQHDGDLSKIEDNTKLNSIISHEYMTMNEKYKASYSARVNAFLFMGTNQPVKISDAKSGIIRRLIDVHPTGVKIPANHYNTLMSKIDFELGAIAQHCLDVYREMGKNYYNAYRPLEMMLQTDVFFNFIEANFDIFKSQDSTTLKQAYVLYKEFCSDTGIDKQLPQYKVREELRNYFDEFKDRVTIDGNILRSHYSGFNANKFKMQARNEITFSLVMEDTESIFDKEFADQPAQLAKADGNPKKYWDATERLINGVLQQPTPRQIASTTLKDIDTTQLHFVKVPENHIVIDFDLLGDDGEKSLERNMEAASNWPATYGELSKSGGGVHLHYTYDGDASELNSEYSEGIEVKVYSGNAALRRLLTKCNNVPIATINSGLPIKEKKVLHANTIQSEKGLRDLIARNLRKEIHPGTKSSIDFIYKILDDAHSQGLSYDVSDLKPRLFAFANNSTNQPMQALKMVSMMKFVGETTEADKAVGLAAERSAEVEDKTLTYYDVEVYPNLFIVCWKFEGDPTVVRMINPSPEDVGSLFKMKLVGFNNRRYDNHILYGRFMGYTNAALYELSQRIIDGRGGTFGEAYDLSYADIYDFSSKKQGLKKFQIEYGIHHMEMDLPWDEDVPEELWDKVADYCVNDVISTEIVFEKRRADFVARQILAELSGLTVNSTTQQHTAKIIFGDDRFASKQFVYTDLSEMFPGYSYEMGISVYRDETTGEGGYVYSEPGIYEDVELYDVASMHPTSIEQLNFFGKYTKSFSDLKNARMAIKHGEYAEARKMLGGRLAPYLENEEDAEALSYALKIVINIVYGLTSAKFDNPFRNVKNKDNIVAKRGALFMIDLKHFVQEQGFQVVHIKTDSIKIVSPTAQLRDDIFIFGQKYGYDFEHEATYSKLCLVNDAVYVAKDEKGWKAVGAQFQHPYVFKTLFSDEPVTFDDLCETKQVAKGVMYLDFDFVQKPMYEVHNKAHFIGRTGRFVPVSAEAGGGVLLRVNEGKSYAVTGTKGYLWLEAEVVEAREEHTDIDMNYFWNLQEDAIKTINKFGTYEDLVR